MGDVFGNLEIGAEEHFRKTVSESDVYLFAGLTGDFNRNHVDAEAMRGTSYGARLVHGALLLGFVSTASTAMINRSGRPAVAYGYDRVRFVAPVYFGDTIQVGYRLAELEEHRRRMTAEVTITNQHGSTVAVARHMVFFPDDDGDID
ncbi:MaoC family dehydratase [Jiangella asiatica]|uniref:Dehydratase n=1 Tax=Jiangella asiatica TaxID=2530372 RepID=A0A4R5D6X3_9ACTN|nr:MaoC/PaaZ C-terminal domain-containing protein [Jiangella asiatica]TDE08357.1 dehydratase [Jiangella asiatica]